MSSLIEQPSFGACTEAPCAGIKKIIDAKSKDLGGFSVRRVLPISQQRMVGPWIFFDHMGPATFAVGAGIDVRPHPHINLATVTYLFEGEILHRDSLGSVQLIRPGDINLMIAGRGIVHSERTPLEKRSERNTVHGLQLWLALPIESEEVEPAFHHYAAAHIPETLVNEMSIRVLIGSAFGLDSPVKTFSETLYFEARMKAGQTIVIPRTAERAVYVASGKLIFKETTIHEHSMSVFEPDCEVCLEAVDDSFIAIIGGAPLGERHIFWNFVSSRKERIEKAKVDWKDNRFPKVPGDESDFIPLPE